MSVLAIVLLLPAMFGGRIEATFHFETKAKCERFYSQIKSYTVRHEVKILCTDEEPPK